MCTVSSENPTKPTLETIMERINALGQEMHRRFDKTDKRLDETNLRLDETNQRLDETNRRIDDSNHSIGDLRATTEREIRAVDRQIGQVAIELFKWKTVISDIEARVANLEAPKH